MPVEKTEYIIESKKFGKRRVWKDGIGPFYVVNNITYRHYEGDDFEIYKAESINNGDKRSTT